MEFWFRFVCRFGCFCFCLSFVFGFGIGFGFGLGFGSGFGFGLVWFSAFQLLFLFAGSFRLPFHSSGCLSFRLSFFFVLVVSSHGRFIPWSFHRQCFVLSYPVGRFIFLRFN